MRKIRRGPVRRRRGRRLNAAPKRRRPVRRKRRVGSRPVRRRQAAPKRRKRTRKAPKRRRAAPKRRKTTRRRKTTKRRSIRKRNVRRRSIRKRGRRRSSRRRRYSNPYGFAEVARKAVAGTAGFLAARLIANGLGMAQFIPMSLRPHAAILGSVGAIAAALYLPQKVKALAPYKNALVIGAGISLVAQLVDRYMPASLVPYLGTPAPAPAGALGWAGSAWEQGVHGWGAQSSAEGFGEYINEPLGEYVSEGGPVMEALAEYIDEPLGMDEDGASVPDYSDLDAGVVEGDGLYGEPGIEELDDVEFLDGGGGADAAPFRAMSAARNVAKAGAMLGKPTQEVMARAAAAGAAVAGAAGRMAMVRQAIAQGVAQGIREAGRGPSLQHPLAPRGYGVLPTYAVPVQDPVMGAPAEVTAIMPDPRYMAQTGSNYGTGSFAGKVPGIFRDHVLHGL